MGLKASALCDDVKDSITVTILLSCNAMLPFGMYQYDVHGLAFYYVSQYVTFEILLKGNSFVTIELCWPLAEYTPPDTTWIFLSMPKYKESKISFAFTSRKYGLISFHNREYRTIIGFSTCHV